MKKKLDLYNKLWNVASLCGAEAQTLS